MEYLQNGFTLEIAPGCFPLSTDSIALSGFAKLPNNARVLDLGAGCGTLGMLLLAKHANCSITGIEIDQAAHAAGIRNAAANHAEDRYRSICADLREIEGLIKAGSFQVCISNPPYFAGGAASKALAVARQEQNCTLEDLFRAAGWALQWGGDFFLVHKPERFAQLCACAVQNGLEPKSVLLLRHRKDGPVSLVLVQCRKGGKPGLTWTEQYLYKADGTPSDYFNSLYH